jgi:type III secretion protein J
MKKIFSHITKLLICTSMLLLVGCSEDQAIVNNVDERDANEIIVFLASKGIESHKMKAESGSAGVGGGGPSMWNIFVPKDKSVNAMALLNSNGLPRKQGTDLLTLFAKSGLMTSDREETIRYQAGLEQQLTNTIRKIDGVLDADVQISFPKTEETLAPGEAKTFVKSAVYVKHQGLLNDPNSHIESKIKRMISSSVDNLDFENVAVILDHSKFSDIKLQMDGEPISSKVKSKEYVSVWSIVMTKTSAGTFRFLFFMLVVLVLVFAGISGYMIYRFYPQFQKSRKTLNKK